MLKFCKKCGTSVQAKTSFCKKCGAQIQRPSAMGATPNVASGNQTMTGTLAASMYTPSVCNKCGSPLKPGAKFCRKCAAPAGVQPQMPQGLPHQMPQGPPQSAMLQTSPRVPPPPMPNMQKPPSPGSDKNMIFKLGASVALVLVFVALVVMITNIGGGETENGAVAGTHASTQPGDTTGATISPMDLYDRYIHAVFTIYASWDGRDFFHMGSGFIIDQSGLAVTAHHCLASPYKQARLHDGRRVDIIGFYNYDTTNDLAVIRLAHGNYQAARIGNSDALRVGEDVFAVGSTGGPFGETYHNTLSTGIHSALIPLYEFSIYAIRNAIQISAPTYGGNSGGPVFNSRGEVIGVLVAGPPGNQTIGIASPINNLDLSPQGLSTLTPFALAADEAEDLSHSFLVGEWEFSEGHLIFFADRTGIDIDWFGNEFHFWWDIYRNILVLYDNDFEMPVAVSIIDHNLIVIGSDFFHRVLW